MMGVGSRESGVGFCLERPGYYEGLCSSCLKPSKQDSIPYSLFPLLLALPTLSGCAGLVNGAGRMLDGSAFREKTLALYRSEGKKGRRVELRRVQNRNGEEYLLIRSEEEPCLTLKGSLPDHRGRFRLLSLHFLGSWQAGWNEFTLDLIDPPGNAVFALAPDGEKGTLRIQAPPERTQIAGGAIRYKETKLSGEEALNTLRNRRERILALTDWMKASLYAPLTREGLLDYWKPRLLPETSPRRRRPPDFHLPGDIYVRDGDLRWNTGYTERAFPEELRAMRNSGALQRDWDEAGEWISLEYRWEAVFASLGERELYRVK